MNLTRPLMPRNTEFTQAQGYDLSTLGGRLAFARSQISPKLTQRALAARLGLDNDSQVSQWENDVRAPETKRLGQLARELGVPMDWLVNGGPLPAGLAQEVPRDTAQLNGHARTATEAETLLPFAKVVRTPAVRARLAALRTELIELGADEEREERIMAHLRDRQRLNEFVGGREEDLYTEREVLQVIENYARIARDVMGTLG